MKTRKHKHNTGAIVPRNGKTSQSGVFGAGAESVLESISDGVFTVDADWRITSFNRAAETITGVRRRDALGKPCAEVFRASMCEADCALRHTVKTGKPVVNKPAFIVNGAGRRIPVSVSTALLRNVRGKIIGGAETFRDLSLVEELRRELAGRFSMGDLVSCSPAMRRIFDILPQVAASDATVLILGDTGTGKELLARAVHAGSPRHDRPFVAVNCGALPDTLLESELFGYVKGAFTGAARDKPGRFALAEGGTVFLDEIGDISPALQVRLLRVLQEKTFEPLGSAKTIRADVRVLAATHRDLAAQIRKGAFREDLFYRLNVISLELPPLCRRKEDVPLLIEHFIGRFNRRENKTIAGVTTAALDLLMAHEYPGNVRELENIIERAFVLCESARIDARHLPPELTARRLSPDDTPSVAMAAHQHAAEAQAIRAALERNRFNRLAAAHELGIHKTTLFRKIKKLGLIFPRPAGTRAHM